MTLSLNLMANFIWEKQLLFFVFTVFFTKIFVKWWKWNKKMGLKAKIINGFHAICCEEWNLLTGCRFCTKYWSFGMTIVYSIISIHKKRCLGWNIQIVFTGLEDFCQNDDFRVFFCWFNFKMLQGFGRNPDVEY